MHLMGYEVVDSQQSIFLSRCNFKSFPGLISKRKYFSAGVGGKVTGTVGGGGGGLLVDGKAAPGGNSGDGLGFGGGGHTDRAAPGVVLLSF